jgi:uncharacterized protein YnzC (UPF0291/DUF896 family)
VEQYKIDRINELARKNKVQGLTPEELEERDALRREYIQSYACSLKDQLEHTYIVDQQGHKRKLQQKEGQ